MLISKNDYKKITEIQNQYLTTICNFNNEDINYIDNIDDNNKNKEKLYEETDMLLRNTTLTDLHNINRKNIKYFTSIYKYFISKMLSILDDYDNYDDEKINEIQKVLKHLLSLFNIYMFIIEYTKILINLKNNKVINNKIANYIYKKLNDNNIDICEIILFSEK
jgi:hypothetical protein